MASYQPGLRPGVSLSGTTRFSLATLESLGNMDVTRWTAGYHLPEVRFALNAEAVRSYRTAVGDTSALYTDDPSLVPPMAVAALSIRHMLGTLGLPPGTVHTSQELTFHRPVTVGQELVCRARVSQASHRKQWLSLVVEFQVDQPDPHPQAEGRSAMATRVAGRSTLFIGLEGSA